MPDRNLLTTKPLTAGLVLFALVLAVLASPAPRAQSTAIEAREVVLRAIDAPVVAGAWTRTAIAGASAPTALWQPDAGVPKIDTASATPQHYFELSFSATAGVPYRLWVRARAANDAYTNDSVFVQFSGSTTSTGAPLFRIGSTDATVYSLEDCNGCGESAWGWQDNGYGAGVLGPAIYFDADGKQTLRVQAREDGIAIDQIVLSPQVYLTKSPGTTKQDATVLPLSDGSVTPAGVTLVRGPYLQQPGSSSISVVWATREGGPAEVRFAAAGGTAVTVPAAGRLVSAATTGLPFDYYQYSAQLSGLAASTKYDYRPFVNGVAAAAAAAFTTAPSTGTGGVTFIAFGDSGVGSSEQRQLAALMKADAFDLVLHAGDIVYGTASGTGDATYGTFQSWFFDIYGWLPAVPFMPSEGNHDSRPSNGNGRAYLDLFMLPSNGASAAYPDHAERYYSFDYGPVHFVALDTEFAFQDAARRAEQLAWLEADLAGTLQPWKVAYFHRSPFSSGGEHGSDLTVRSAFGPLFERYGVDLAISAHEHVYERTIPINETTDPANRAVTYVVSGGGGGPLYPSGTSPWTAFSASRHGYTKVTVAGCVLTLQEIGLDGSAFDSASLSHCAPPPPPSSDPPEVVLYAGSAPVRAGAWQLRPDPAAAAGQLLVHPDAGAAKLTTPLPSPVNYFELTFNAVAGVPYHLWIRGKAAGDFYGNDSVFAQFDRSVDQAGAAVYRTGTSSAAQISIEDCSGCGLSGWGWQDNSYSGFGSDIYFSATGPQRLRIQTREDGLSIDQVVLSPRTYLKSRPGAAKNDTTVLPSSGGS
jgi:hypothetical protein